VEDPANGPDLAGPAAEVADLPTRQSLGFAAAPVATDYAPPAAPADHAAPADPAQGALPAGPVDGPSYLWDLAATDVFPVAPAAENKAEDAPGASES
jgi:hypothetical protein